MATSRGLGRAAGESELVLLWSDAGELDTGGRARWQLGWSIEADEEYARGSVIVKRKITGQHSHRQISPLSANETEPRKSCSVTPVVQPHHDNETRFLGL